MIFIYFFVSDEHHIGVAELQQKLCIKAKGKGGKLLRVIANPITKHLSSPSRKIGKILIRLIMLKNDSIPEALVLVLHFN